MKPIVLLFFLILLAFTSQAQQSGDTITIQSLVHTSQTRDTMVSFPNLPNVTFEKIIMKYNMRCKGARVSTPQDRNQGCGEWDYSCNTFITDSSKIASNTNLTYDTISLPDGCYSFLVTDTDDDGIDFFANNDGTGVIQLRAMSNTILQSFDGDFGKYLRYNFTVNKPLSYEEFFQDFNATLYPNPTSDVLNIEAKEIENAHVEILDALGKRLSLPIRKRSDKLEINTASLANGLYIIKLNKDNRESAYKFFVRH